MPWEPEHNRRSLSPHGLKMSEGHGARAMHDPHSVGCAPMPDGILSMTPLGAGRSSPYGQVSSRPPRGEPAHTTVPHNPAPHRYGGDPKLPNTYGKVPHR
jgi:hypothetical protein